MARCPNCRRTFRVMEDERPEDHGCPSCGYGTAPEPAIAQCPDCHGTGVLTDADGIQYDDPCEPCMGSGQVES